MSLSRPDARDTGAALLIRGDGALGVETPAHKDEESAQGRGKRTRTAGEALRLRIGHKGGAAVPPLGEAGRGLTG